MHAQERGIVPRVMENIFEMIGKKAEPVVSEEQEQDGEDAEESDSENRTEHEHDLCEAEAKKYKVSFSLIEIRRNHIHDLITLSPYQINDVGEDGPKVVSILIFCAMCLILILMQFKNIFILIFRPCFVKK